MDIAQLIYTFIEHKIQNHLNSIHSTSRNYQKLDNIYRTVNFMSSPFYISSTTCDTTELITYYLKKLDSNQSILNAVYSEDSNKYILKSTKYVVNEITNDFKTGPNLSVLSLPKFRKNFANLLTQIWSSAAVFPASVSESQSKSGKSQKSQNSPKSKTDSPTENLHKNIKISKILNLLYEIIIMLCFETSSEPDQKFIIENLVEKVAEFLYHQNLSSFLELESEKFKNEFDSNYRDLAGKVELPGSNVNLSFYASGISTSQITIGSHPTLTPNHSHNNLQAHHHRYKSGNETIYNSTIKAGSEISPIEEIPNDTSGVTTELGQEAFPMSEISVVTVDPDPEEEDPEALNHSFAEIVTFEEENSAEAGKSESTTTEEAGLEAVSPQPDFQRPQVPVHQVLNSTQRSISDISEDTLDKVMSFTDSNSTPVYITTPPTIDVISMNDNSEISSLKSGHQDMVNILNTFTAHSAALQGGPGQASRSNSKTANSNATLKNLTSFSLTGNDSVNTIIPNVPSSLADNFVANHENLLNNHELFREDLMQGGLNFRMDRNSILEMQHSVMTEKNKKSIAEIIEKATSNYGARWGQILDKFLQIFDFLLPKTRKNVQNSPFLEQIPRPLHTETTFRHFIPA